MRKTGVIAAAVAATGVLGGAVFATAITNVVALGPAASESNVTECYDPTHATMTVNSKPSWDDTTRTWVLPSAQVVIDDSASGAWVQCEGQEVNVTAVDGSGNVIASGVGSIPATGNVDLNVNLTGTGYAGDVAEWVSAITGPRVEIEILTFVYPSTSFSLAQTNQVLTPSTNGVGNPVWSATGLPDGVSINSTTGQVTGPSVFELPAQNIAVGFSHACAVNSGTVYCWGNNGSYQLGNTFTSQPTPQATTVTGAGTVATGRDFTCATVSGSVYCWGSNSTGQLGNGTYSPGSRTATPTLVQGITNATAVTAGEDFACAIDSGEVKCWGGNGAGQTGVGSGATRVLTATGINLNNYTAVNVSAGTRHACLTTNTDDVYCWGAGTDGRLGTGSTSNVANPQLVTTGTDVAAGDDHTCVVGTDDSVACTGSNSFSQLGRIGSSSTTFVPVAGTDASSVTAGQWFTCANGDGGTVCWGYGQSGQLGNGTFTNTATPTAVTGVAADVVAGTSNTCAVHSGVAKCWGRANYGVNGNANTWSDKATAVKVASPGYPATVVVTSADNVSLEVYDQDTYTLTLTP